MRSLPCAARYLGPVALITAGMDLQHDRAEIEIVGLGTATNHGRWLISMIHMTAGEHLWQEVDRGFARSSDMKARECPCASGDG